MSRPSPSSQKRSPHAWPPADSATVREKGFLREAAVVKAGSFKRSSNCKMRNISDKTGQLCWGFFSVSMHWHSSRKKTYLLRKNVPPPQMNVDGVQRGFQKKELTLTVERATLENRQLSICYCRQFQTWILFYWNIRMNLTGTVNSCGFY